MQVEEIVTYLYKIFVFYFPQKAVYWNSKTKCCILEKSVELGNYFLDFSSKAFYPQQLSADGIPIFNYKTFLQTEQPAVAAQYAFGILPLLAKENFNHLELEKKYLNVADWFVKNKQPFNEGIGCI